MPAPRVSIDQLPVDDSVTGVEYLVAQDGATTKRISVSALPAYVGLNAHLADATDAHMASAIGATPSAAPMVGATVQTQLEQASNGLAGLQGDIAALEARITALEQA